MRKDYDVLIIGGGPAGLTAAVYCGRAAYRTLVCEQQLAGGQIATTERVDNYPGFPQGIAGMQLGQLLDEHARRFGAELLSAPIESVDLDGSVKTIVTADGAYHGKALIIASGTTARPLNVPGENLFQGRGVSYCATCDGPFFKDREVAVVGGGDAAVEEALYLTRFVRKVTLIHRRDRLRAVQELANRAQANERIDIIWNAQVQEIYGDKLLEGVVIAMKDGSTRRLAVSGLFIYTGRQANTAFLNGKPEMDAAGFIKAGEDTLTSVGGVFAAGDVRVKKLRQVVTAVADGAVAAYAAGHYIESH